MLHLAHGLNPDAVKAMEELGIDISGHQSDLIDSTILDDAAYVITLCGDANDKRNAIRCETGTLGVPRSSQSKGTEEEKWTVFQQVRDQIRVRIQQFSGQVI